MDNDRARQLSTLATAIGQTALPLALFAVGFNGPGTDLATTAPNAATPAGYAFSIWWPIFMFAIYTAVRGMRADQKTHVGFQRVGWWMAALYGAAMLWMLCAWFGPSWSTVVVIILMLGLALSAFVRAMPFQAEPAWRYGIVPGLGLYAGWLTAATWVNIADVLPMYGIGPFGLSAQSIGVGVVIATTLTAALVLVRVRGHLAYAGALAWALVAIIINVGATTPVAIASIAAMAVLAGVSLLFRSVR